MPETTSTTSEPEDDGSSAPSVLDFLYHDDRRVGSFLSQFEGDGHLQELTRTITGSRGKISTVGSDLKGSAKIVSAEKKSSLATSVDMDVGYSRVFDPFWANARAFLDYLSDNDMLQRDPAAANIGQFVLAKGYLSIQDLAMLKDAWKLPTLQKKIMGGAGSSKQFAQMTAAEKAAHREEKENTELFIELMQVLPHAIHATLLSGIDTAQLVWCALREEYLITPASDLTLAHGSMLSGEWSIVGILSAYPEWAAPVISTEASELEPGLMQSVVGMVSQQLAPIVRTALGRPGAAYSVTPLLIFREVA